MSNMKCPICGTQLEYDFGYDGDYSCAKCGRAKMFGSEELWQELIRTRKALDVAVDALTTIGGYLDYNDCVGIALDAKDEIYKALEQKDVK